MFDEKITLKYLQHADEEPTKVTILNNFKVVIEFAEGVCLTEVAVDMFKCIEWSGCLVKVIAGLYIGQKPILWWK